jgi:hypothetical protein
VHDLDDTVPLSAVEETVKIRASFVERWGLWITGVSLVFTLTVAVFASVVGAHGAASTFRNTPGNLPVPLPAKTAKNLERIPWTPKSSAA